MMRLLAAAFYALAIACAAQPTNELRYFLVITGGELLEGVYADGHTPFITRTLYPLGGKCVGSISVDDDRSAMLAALAYATNKAPVVIVTGGLGPTSNDMTREILAEFAKIPLRENEMLLRQMEQRLGEPRDTIRANLRKQTLVPSTGYFTNAPGTAAGLIFDLKDHLIVALPGPPRELQPMVLNELIPYLKRNYDLHEHTTRLVVRFYGIGQSQITQIINDKIKLPDGTIVTSLFDGMRVDFFFTLPEKSDTAQLKLTALKKSLQQNLGNHIYALDGSTSLEDVVLGKFHKSGRKLLILDNATGGAVGAALYSQPEASKIVVANIAAPSLAEKPIQLAKKYGANFLLIITPGKIEYGPITNLQSARIDFQSVAQFTSEILNKLR